MTNKQYHRRRRALERLERQGPNRDVIEYRRVLWLVNDYRAGLLRAKNGRGPGLHSSGALA